MNTIVRVFLFIVLCVVLSGIAVPISAQSTSPDDFSKVDEYVTETMRGLPIKGLALSIVQGDQVIYMKGYGIANIQGEPVTPQTPFMLGSITKSFTALAVQQLISTGKIGESKPVKDYLPGFRLADDRSGAGVSIRHLLDHTSGISKEEGEAPYLNSPTTIFSEALDRLARFQPEYAPGEHYEYSNWNYALLREVIEKASGQSYTSYMQENIFAPLDMSNASFADYHTLPHAATYDLNVFGFPVPYDEPINPATAGACLLSASAEDMSHFLIAILNLGKYQDQSLIPLRHYGWFDGYWNWRGMDASNEHIQFSGSHNSTQANMQVIPQKRLGVAVLINTRLDETTPSAPSANDIALNIAKMMMGKPYTLPNIRGFYTTEAVIVGLLLILIFTIVWQAFHLKDWRKHYQEARPARKRTATTVIVLDLLICAGILALPFAFQTNWNSMLSLRPDFSIPIFAVGLCLGVLGLIKAAASMIPQRQNA